MAKLKSWIRENKLRYADAAERFGCSEIRVRKLCQDINPAKPGRKLAERIVSSTNGEVGFEDLFIVENVSVSDAAA